MTFDIEDRLRRDLAAAVAAPVRPAPPLERRVASLQPVGPDDPRIQAPPPPD